MQASPLLVRYVPCGDIGDGVDHPRDTEPGALMGVDMGVLWFTSLLCQMCSPGMGEESCASESGPQSGERWGLGHSQEPPIPLE